MSREKIEKNCNECLHFEACCKWTDFPKQIGFPTCRKFAPISGNRKQSEWISVEERLPEHLQKILIYDEFQKMTVATYIAYSNGGGDWSTPVRINGKITHWMPLPEAPEMKQTKN